MFTQAVERAATYDEPGINYIVSPAGRKRIYYPLFAGVFYELDVHVLGLMRVSLVLACGCRADKAAG